MSFLFLEKSKENQSVSALQVMQHPFCFITFYSQVESSNAHAQVLNFEQKRKKDIGQEKLGKEAKGPSVPGKILN